MIPKVIHYIWLGGKPLPELVKKCMESWKKYCPDWEIKRWDESNLDVNFCDYCRDAYKEKKYAFASDVLRFKIIKENGGVYLDVDVELLKPLDDLLNQKCFMGYELWGDIFSIAPGLILGSEKNGVIVSEIFDMYLKEKLYNEDNSINFETVCMKTMKYMVEKYGIQPDGKTIHLEDVSIYSPEYFCPMNGLTKKMQFLTSETYSKHLYLASWVPKESFFKIIKNNVKKFIIKIIGKKNINKLKNIFKRRKK